jgi:uncharacterized protein (TIGR00725 family)
MMKIVAVVGAGECDSEIAAEAEEIGRLLAQRGFAVVCGGLGGVMAAVCRGAKAAGGLTIGILPGTDPVAANAWVDVPIASGLGEARNLLVVRAAQAVIAVGGEYGTLCEIAFALKIGKAVVGLRTWQLARAGTIQNAFVEVNTSTEAVEQCIKAIE